MTTLYGIPNCGTVKKARLWLDEHQQAYAFGNFKTDPPTAEQLQHWLAAVGAERLINRKGTTWRGLSEADKAAADTQAGAIALMQTQPSMIKRPVLVHQDRIEVGFSPEQYQAVFSR